MWAHKYNSVISVMLYGTIRRSFMIRPLRLSGSNVMLVLGLWMLQAWQLILGLTEPWSFETIIRISISVVVVVVVVVVVGNKK